MKAVAMKINKRTFVPPEEISLFQNFNLTRMLFFLNDSLLLQKFRISPAFLMSFSRLSAEP